jgi:dienelactone hydrolase
MRISDFVVSVGGTPLTCSLAQPDGPLTPNPALLLTFGMTRQSALTEHPHDLPTRIFLAAGHSVLSFDLPNHGQRVDAHGEGIGGLCAAFLAGHDPFGRFIADGQAVIDACLQRGLAAEARIFACGVSRAAYCALRLAAADRRIAGVAGLAPVTDWRALSEFAAAKNRPEVAALALDHWAADLAGRPVFLAIGNRDERVGTDCCARLALHLFEEEARRGLSSSLGEFHVVPEAGHSLSDGWRRAGGEYLLQMASELITRHTPGVA